jgi:DNA (cytosine-5)-methyltransferase 1
MSHAGPLTHVSLPATAPGARQEGEEPTSPSPRLENERAGLAYYNEHDPFAAQWLRNLIAAGRLPAGHVDQRDIQEVTAHDLRGYAQVHFFAGIGGWPLALALAGWPATRPVWTGSCPCQPFSAAGQQRGTDDARHLWPVFARLIAECRPPVVFGEQVASALGRGWLAGVRSDLEALGYAVGGADLCAAGGGAPHIRQRLYWVADADHQGLEGRRRSASGSDQCTAGAGCLVGGVADAMSTGRPEGGPEPGHGSVAGGCGPTGGVADADARRRGEQQATHHDDGALASRYDADRRGQHGRPCPPDSPWRAADWLRCRDDRWRPVEPGTFPLADGVPGRVGRLRAYGNAIVPQLAAAFIGAWLDAEGGR